MGCFGLTEPDHGSNPGGMTTNFKDKGDHYLLNGAKMWISNAPFAQVAVVWAKDESGRIHGLIVERGMEGFSTPETHNKWSLRASATGELIFDNVKVPKENIVGKVNQGWTMAKSLLGAERITIGAPKIARLPLQLVKQLATDNGLFDDPAFRARYTELLLDVDDLDAAFIRFGEVLRRGDELGPEVSMLKVWITEAAQRATDMLVEVGGEASLTNDSIELSDGGSVHPANHSFASRPASIYGGTNEIQRNILAKAVLQLPG